MKIKLMEYEVVDHIKQFIDNCDGDELARICGEIFGGECFASEEVIDEVYTGEIVYDFEPNEFYGGEFDENDDYGYAEQKNFD